MTRSTTTKSAAQDDRSVSTRLTTPQAYHAPTKAHSALPRSRWSARGAANMPQSRAMASGAPMPTTHRNGESMRVRPALATAQRLTSSVASAAATPALRNTRISLTTFGGIMADDLEQGRTGTCPTP